MKTIPVIFINEAGRGAIRSFPELVSNALIEAGIARRLTDAEIKDFEKGKPVKANDETEKPKAKNKQKSK